MVTVSPSFGRKLLTGGETGVLVTPMIGINKRTRLGMKRQIGVGESAEETVCAVVAKRQTSGTPRHQPLSIPQLEQGCHERQPGKVVASGEIWNGS